MRTQLSTFQVMLTCICCCTISCDVIGTFEGQRNSARCCWLLWWCHHCTRRHANPGDLWRQHGSPPQPFGSVANAVATDRHGFDGGEQPTSVLSVRCAGQVGLLGLQRAFRQVGVHITLTAPYSIRCAGQVGLLGLQRAFRQVGAVQCSAVRCSVYGAVCMVQYGAVWCSAVQCGAVWCS